jgi:hypothetical protein
VEIVSGPGDEDVAALVKAKTSFPIQEFPMATLIRRLRAYQGTIVCFNSFLAHLCHYLGKPALVIHRNAVPYGYDCSAIHTQLVLQADHAWNPREVLNALGASRNDDADPDSESHHVRA